MSIVPSFSLPSSFLPHTDSGYPQGEGGTSRDRYPNHEQEHLAHTQDHRPRQHGATRALHSKAHRLHAIGWCRPRCQSKRDFEKINTSLPLVKEIRFKSQCICLHSHYASFISKSVDLINRKSCQVDTGPWPSSPLHIQSHCLVINTPAFSITEYRNTKFHLSKTLNW